MKKSGYILALCISFAPSMSIADVASDARNALQMFQPKRVGFNNGTLTTVLPQAQITQQVFLSVITTGICFAEYLGGDLSAVKEVEVLNRHGAQGFVYEAGIEDCKRINNVPVGTAQDALILGKTHWF